MTLSDILRPVSSTMKAVFALGFIASGFTLLAPIAVTQLSHSALAGNLTATSVWFWLAMIVLGFVASHLIATGATGHAHMVESKFRYDLRSRIARHMGRLPLGWHTSEASGRVRTIISEDVTKIHTIIAHTGTDLGHAVGTILLGSIYLFTLSWQYALVVVGWLVVSIVVFSLAMLTNPTTSMEVFNEAEKDLTASTIELADGIATVKAFGMSGSLFQRFSDALDRYTNASYAWMKGPGKPMAVMMALISPAGMLVPILVGAWALVGAGIVEPILIVPFLLVGVTLPSGLANVVPLMHLVERGKDAAESIGALLAEPALPEAAEPRTIPEGARADIVFENVSFRYAPDAPWALREIDARFPADRVTAVVGPSGSGKSTLVKLIARFWDVDEGRVLLSGVPITELASSDLLSRLTIVLQDGGLLTDTVEANIRLGRPLATREQVEAAAHRARIDGRIRELPDGYDSVIGTGGVHFSGGEAQRIALARAFLTGSEVLLLDEATAQADPHSERQIQEALGTLAAGRTTIVIAHRLATIVDADQILVLDSGRIVESGTHAELLTRGGTYAAMWEAQQ
ncbi:ABC transporter ATP-binding protein [Schaalia sp. 19OD2882]|uniref:ABC transporter ATP-binding protein n=1 Tax=Schaalia sp. 19OD2882 TaxID=2794089 RepID=UPI001C1F174A|nr:ABC transporter ATP-binding protein [Schaalia sp. 19OD2882]QWW19275.1 ABC transporter ATP-binding protein [Schaalia sp. 19OD2882]